MADPNARRRADPYVALRSRLDEFEREELTRRRHDDSVPLALEQAEAALRRAIATWTSSATPS